MMKDYFQDLMLRVTNEHGTTINLHMNSKTKMIHCIALMKTEYFEYNMAYESLCISRILNEFPKEECSRSRTNKC